MRDFLGSVCAFLYSLLLIHQLQRHCETLGDHFAKFSQKTIVQAQTIMTTVKRLSVALRDTAHVCHHTIKRLWVRGSHLLLRLVQWSAVLCLTAMVAAVLYPMACVGIITALAFACLEMGWLFWLLRLDVASIAAVSGAWCQRIFRSVKAGPSKIWSAIQALSAFHIGICFLNRLVDGLSIFKSHIKSCFSKATAYTTQTMLYAMRKFIALTWLLTMYPVVLLAKVSR